MRGENPQGSRFGQALGIETACDESSYRSMPYFQFIPQRGKAGGIIPPVAVNGALLSNLAISLPASDRDFHCVADHNGQEHPEMDPDQILLRYIHLV